MLFQGVAMVDRNAEALVEQVLTWPSAERARFAALLLASIEPGESDIAAAWDEEVVRRIAELDMGHAVTIPADDVFAELDRRLRK